MKSRLISSSILSLSIVLINVALPQFVAANGLQKTGAHGGSIVATTSQKGNKVTGNATATTATGKNCDSDRNGNGAPWESHRNRCRNGVRMAAPPAVPPVRATA